MSTLSGYSSNTTKSLSGVTDLVGDTFQVGDVTINNNALSGIASFSANNLSASSISVSGNASIGGTLTNTAFQSLQSKTQYQTATGNVTSFTGSVSSTDSVNFASDALQAYPESESHRSSVTVTGDLQVNYDLLFGRDVTVNRDTTLNGNVTQTTGTASLQALNVPSISCSGNLTQSNGTASLQALTVPSISCSGNATITGNITNTAFQQSQSDISALQSDNTTLQTKTQNLSATSGNTTLTGTTTLGGLPVVPNTKGNTALTNCWTVGTQEAQTAGQFPPFSPSTTPQNSYVFSASSWTSANGSGNVASAWNTGGQYYDSTNQYSNGSYTGTASVTDVDGVTTNGEWVQTQIPVEITNPYQFDFYNDYRSGIPATNTAGKTFYLFFKQFEGDTWRRAVTVTYANNSYGSKTLTFTYPYKANYVLFQCTALTNIASAYSWRVRSCKLSAYTVDITQNVYLPSALLVGDTTDTTLNTASALQVNGDTDAKGSISVADSVTVNNLLTTAYATIESGIKFGAFNNWKPYYSMPNQNVGGASCAGYYLFPGGLLIQWGWVADAATQSWTYPVAFTYVYSVQVTKGTATSGYVPCKINSWSTTSVSLDSAQGSSDKSDLTCFAIGRKDGV